MHDVTRSRKISGSVTGIALDSLIFIFSLPALESVDAFLTLLLFYMFSVYYLKSMGVSYPGIVVSRDNVHVYVYFD